MHCTEKSMLTFSWMRASSGTDSTIFVTVSDSPVRAPSSVRNAAHSGSGCESREQSDFREGSSNAATARTGGLKSYDANVCRNLVAHVDVDHVPRHELGSGDIGLQDAVAQGEIENKDGRYRKGAARSCQVSAQRLLTSNSPSRTHWALHDCNSLSASRAFSAECSCA